MKKIILSIALLSLTILIHAQNNAVEDMFNKYSEKQGFTLVSISSKMFSMFADLDKDSKDADNIISRLKSIRILSVEDSLLNKDLNFYTELSKKLDLSAYEELLVVKNGPDITKFLIKESGKNISELLVIKGGPDGNSLISIKGDLSLKNISDISKDIDIKELKGIDKLEKTPHEE
jgi:hypothetical protein